MNEFAISGIFLSARHRETDRLVLLITARTLHPSKRLDALEVVVHNPEASTLERTRELKIGAKLSASGRIQRRFTPDDPDPLRAMHGVVELVATDSGVAFE